MGNRKRKRLILPTLFIVLLLISVAIMLYVNLHITPRGIVHNMGEICEESVIIAESNKALMDETYAKLIRFPKLSKKYLYKSLFFVNNLFSPKINRKINLSWDKLFSYSFTTDIQIKYEEKYSYEELKRGPLTLDMIDAFIVTGGCQYTFEVDHSDTSSYKLKINSRGGVVTISPDGVVDREYYLRFPHIIEEWMRP